MLKAGDRVPDFAQESELLGAVSSQALRGKRYVIYFYPKDDTPGCTKEACSFRDNLPRFEQLRVPVFGVSADDEKSHIRFARKYNLNFRLIPDPEHKLLKAFGTWVEKSMYGKTYMGVARSTFVVDAKGVVEKVWEKVSPEGHAEEVLAYLASGAAARSTPTPASATASAKTPVKARRPVMPAVRPGAKRAPRRAASVAKPAPAKRTASRQPAAKPAAPRSSTARRPAARRSAPRKARR